MLPPPAGEKGWSIAFTDLTARRTPPPGLAGVSVPLPFSFSLLIPTSSLARSARLGGCHHYLAPHVLPPRVPRPHGSSCPRLSWRVRPHVSRLDYCLVTMQLSESSVRATISNTNFLATLVAFWSGMGKHSSHFEK